MVTEIVVTQRFEKKLKRVRDKRLKSRLKKKIKEIIGRPELGKPLRFSLREERAAGPSHSV